MQLLFDFSSFHASTLTGFSKGDYDPRPLDVWGAAIVMLCVTTNGLLWAEARHGSSPVYDELVQALTTWNAEYPTTTITTVSAVMPRVAFFDHYISPPALRRLLLAMLNPDPSRRVSIDDVARGRWMKGIECCQLDREADVSIDV